MCGRVNVGEGGVHDMVLLISSVCCSSSVSFDFFVDFPDLWRGISVSVS